MQAIPFTLRTFLVCLLLNTIIAVALSVFDERSLGDNMVYSHCIGLCIWAISYFAWDWFKGRKEMLLVVPVSVLAGYLAGLALADVFLHNNSLPYLLNQPRKFLGLLLVSLSAGAFMAWYFWSHAKLLNTERQMTEARLKLLESQLQPHMLLNTLANLHSLIAIDPQAAQTMLDHLTAYLRATLNASRASTHTLEAEFARLDDYLALMQIRMGSRLQYTLHLPDDLRKQPIPTLLLQPLVENAIRHGLEPKVQGGRVDITATARDGVLQLSVSDTGLGLQMTVANPTTHGTGFGLEQVRERLQTSFGAQFAMNLEATAAGGARASIEIPLQSELPP